MNAVRPALVPIRSAAGLAAAALCLLLPLPAAGRPEPAARHGIADLAVVMPRASCESLARYDLEAIGGRGSVVTSAAETNGVQGQPVCAIEGRLAPAITFRVELPTRSWTQRYLQTGCGGLCGNLSLRIGAADRCPVVKAGGFVVASTDMGHQGMGGDFGRDARKRADFAYRGVHLTALAAKALIRAFYGQAERFSYFSGCSDGGREALVEAQRFPLDFDGIVAGAPAMNFVVQNSLFHGWQARSNSGADGRAILVAPRLPILHAAVLKACDALDGLADGLVSAPGECHFDPASLACAAGQAPAPCLTREEAEVARRFYAGPRDPRTGERLTQGGPQYGSELQWAGVYVPQSADQPIFSSKIANDSMGNLIFPSGEPASVGRIAFDRATFDALRARHRLFDATSPDLAAFAGHGGKLILFHGWADPHISPLNTIAYHDALRAQMGARAGGFERLFLMPGMGHCSGGEGPSELDLLTPVMAWVERGVAPEMVVASTPSRTTTPRSRPVYAYPYIAAYSGTGDPNAAANWRRGRKAPVAVPAWAGSDFYRPYPGITG